MNGPGVPKDVAPEGVVTSKLKGVTISGTDLAWFVGGTSTYVDADGKVKKGVVQGLGILQPPVGKPGFEPGFVQIHIIYEDYRDVAVLADHLVIKHLHISDIAVPAPAKLVVPGK